MTPRTVTATRALAGGGRTSYKLYLCSDGAYRRLGREMAAYRRREAGR